MGPRGAVEAGLGYIWLLGPADFIILYLHVILLWRTLSFQFVISTGAVAQPWVSFYVILNIMNLCVWNDNMSNVMHYYCLPIVLMFYLFVLRIVCATLSRHLYSRSRLHLFKTLQSNDVFKKKLPYFPHNLIYKRSLSFSTSISNN